MSFKNNNLDNDIIADINVTPLIDIMLVLLILFMVTSSMKFEAGLDIQLPKSSKQSAIDNDSGTVVSLDRNGIISIDGENILRDHFVVKLKSILANKKIKLIIFEGDTSSTLGATIELMDLAKKAGAINFAIATDRK